MSPPEEIAPGERHSANEERVILATAVMSCSDLLHR